MNENLRSLINMGYRIEIEQYSLDKNCLVFKAVMDMPNGTSWEFAWKGKAFAEAMNGLLGMVLDEAVIKPCF